MMNTILTTLRRVCALASCVWGLLLLAGSAHAEEPVKDLTYFLKRLRTVDHLPEIGESHTAMSSTWDESGGNLDGWHHKKVEGDRNVLLDVAGPGCVHRMFTGWLGAGKDILGKPGVAGTRIQVILDEAEVPVLDLPVEKFFDDRNGPFPYPLVFHKTYPGTLMPIPFARHCRIQLVNADAPNWGNFWQVTYTTYTATSKVESLKWPLDSAEKAELQRVQEAWLEAESREPARPSKWTVEKELNIESGKGEEIVLDGAGVIRQFRAVVWPPTPELFRGLRMQFRWDGLEKPSVDVPLGYFFGNADYGYLNEIHFNSLLLGVTNSETYSCFPMPFEAGAVMRLENRSLERAHRVKVFLDIEKRETIPANWGRFHTTWKEARAATSASLRMGPKNEPVHLVLDQKGRGKYVGTLLHVQWPHRDWWGEGDWMIWTDEDAWPPSYHGTGSEEYFNSGWCAFDRKAVSGYIKTRPGEIGLYSFHLNDSFEFRRNIRVAEETFGMDGAGMIGNTIINRDHPIWGSTAFWYGLPARDAGSTQELVERR